MSHPTWVRGLKQATFPLVRLFGVAPYVGAWIETTGIPNPLTLKKGRTLRGCVD